MGNDSSEALAPFSRDSNGRKYLNVSVIAQFVLHFGVIAEIQVCRITT